MVEIKEVKTKKDLRKFAGFNEKMYRNVPQAMPDLISDEMANFNPKKNPAYSYAESRQWLLWSSVFVTLMAKKYRFMQFELDMVFDTH